MRQNSNFQNKTLQDRKFGKKWKMRFFMAKNQMFFEVKLPLPLMSTTLQRTFLLRFESPTTVSSGHALRETTSGKKKTL